MKAGNLRAVGLLVQLGAMAEPVFVDCLDDPDPRLRALGALALARLGRIAESAREALHALADDPDSDVRRAAESALERSKRAR